MDAVYRFLVSLGFTDPIHPVFNHIPIGLVVAALVFGFISLIVRRAVSPAARYSIILALIAGIPTILFGIADWQHYFSGAWIFPIKIKLFLAIVLMLLLAAAIVLAVMKYRIATVVVYALAVLTVFWLGFYGGQLVFGGRAPIPAGHEQGAFVFRGNCLGCHPYGGNILEPKHSLWGSGRLKEYNIFVRWIRNPGAPMPAFPSSGISDAEAQKLYEYVNLLFGGHGH